MRNNLLTPAFSDPNQYPFINDPNQVIDSMVTAKNNLQAKYHESVNYDYNDVSYLEYIYDLHETIDHLISEYFKEINNSMKGGNDLEGRNNLDLRLRAKTVYNSDAFKELLDLHKLLVREIANAHHRGARIDMSYKDDSRNELKMTLVELSSYQDLKEKARNYARSVDNAYNRQMRGN